MVRCPAVRTLARVILLSDPRVHAVSVVECGEPLADVATARHHRALLARALRSAGFVNYLSEWWHWS